jgi:hypothetical protein
MILILRFWSSSDLLNPQQGLLHPEVWTMPTWASTLVLHLHVLNLHLNALIVHLNALNPLTLYRNSYMKWILDVQIHHLECNIPNHLLGYAT